MVNYDEIGMGANCPSFKATENNRQESFRSLQVLVAGLLLSELERAEDQVAISLSTSSVNHPFSVNR